MALLLGTTATIASWYFIDDVSVVGLIVLSAYAFSPWLFLALKGTPLRDPARGAALVAFSLLTVAVYRSGDDSSTAGLGIAFLPIYLWIVGLVIIVADAVLGSRVGDSDEL